MSLEPGLPNYRVIPTPKFTRTAKALKKSYKGVDEKQMFTDCVAAIIELLTLNPRPSHSRLEPWPGGWQEQLWEFRKLVFPMPRRTGASGEGRLMYLINESDRTPDWQGREFSLRIMKSLLSLPRCPVPKTPALLY